MTEIPYSKREIDSHFDDIKETLKRQDAVLLDIRTQTTKTNGRVSSLENWRWLLMGGGAVVLFILTAVIIPIVLKSL